MRVACSAALVAALVSPLSVLGLEVGVYFESRCPSCQEFVSEQLVKQLAPASMALLRAGVTVHPVPYGNTKETRTQTGHYQYTCQHGPEECYLERVQACGLSLLDDSQIHIWAPWIDCVNKSYVDIAALKKSAAHIARAAEASRAAVAEAKRAAAAARAAAEAAKHGELGPAAKDAGAAAEAAAAAAHDASMSSMEVTAAAAAAAAGGEHFWLHCPVALPGHHPKVFMIEALLCSLSPMGERLQHMMAEQTLAHDYVPWVTLDKKRSALAEKDLRCAICVSPAGQEDALREFCAGTEGCDKAPSGTTVQAEIVSGEEQGVGSVDAAHGVRSDEA